MRLWRKKWIPEGNPVRAAEAFDAQEDDCRDAFERAYAAAREADLNKEFVVALARCRFALGLLRSEQLFGHRQPVVESALRARIRALEARNEIPR